MTKTSMAHQTTTTPMIFIMIITMISSSIMMPKITGMNITMIESRGGF